MFMFKLFKYINDTQMFFLAWLYNIFESRKLEKIHYDNQTNDITNRYTLVAFNVESFTNVYHFHAWVHILNEPL